MLIAPSSISYRRVMSDDELILSDSEWLPHHIDTATGTVGFLHIPRDVHRAVTFLDDEYLTGRAFRQIRFDRIPPPASPPRKLHFVFHSAFCCSTLLIRALDVPGVSMGLKEPAILNDLASLMRSGRLSTAALPRILALLDRPMDVDETIVVKPSNVANTLILPILAHRPNAAVLLLHAPLRVFLVSVAKKGMWGRIWTRRLYTLLRTTPAFEPGFAADDLFTQTDLQIAALAWLQQQSRFAAIVQQRNVRVRTLDSETLLRDRSAVLVAVARHFGLAIDEETATGIATGDAFTEHSKRLGERYDENRRVDENLVANAAHREEIDMVVTWATAIAAQFSIPMNLAQPLLA